MSDASTDSIGLRTQPPTTTGERGANGLAEVAVVLAAWGVVMAAVLTTYVRVAPKELYHVSREGWANGLGYLLVYANFPFAFIALAATGFAAGRAWEVTRGNRTRQIEIAVLSGITALFCLVAAIPGVVKQSDLDARWINVVPAAGSLTAIMLVIWTARAGGLGRMAARRQDDPARLALAVVVGVLSLPWIFSEAGVYIGDLPLLGRIFMSTQRDASGAAAVHLGDHHGFSGVLFVLTALLLGRALPEVRNRWLRGALSWYLAFMLVYGLANFANDVWEEQVFKRGWASRRIPSMVLPHPTIEWAILLIALALAWLIGFRPRAIKPTDRRRPAPAD